MHGGTWSCLACPLPLCFILHVLGVAEVGLEASSSGGEGNELAPCGAKLTVFGACAACGSTRPKQPGHR